jgi:hypothetical protein
MGFATPNDLVCGLKFSRKSRTESLDADLTEGLRSWSSIAGDRFSGIDRKIRRET